jgi:AcrR family transcriptional regulator
VRRVNEGDVTVPAKNADKRVERSKAKVMAETYRQLSRAGVGGVSIDEIARNSGVAKTTIYRHWPSRSALVIDACSSLGSNVEAPDTGDIRADLISLLVNLAEQLQNASWSSVYPSIIDAAERDAEIATMQRALHAAFMAPIETVVERGKAKGQPGPERSTSSLVASLVGPLFYRRWFSKEKIDERFVADVVDGTIPLRPKV